MDEAAWVIVKMVFRPIAVPSFDHNTLCFSVLSDALEELLFPIELFVHQSGHFFLYLQICSSLHESFIDIFGLLADVLRNCRRDSTAFIRHASVFSLKDSEEKRAGV